MREKGKREKIVFTAAGLAACMFIFVDVECCDRKWLQQQIPIPNVMFLDEKLFSSLEFN
jgi:hypothetical protein